MFVTPFTLFFSSVFIVGTIAVKVVPIIISVWTIGCDIRIALANPNPNANYSSVSLSDKITTLGVTLDSCLTFNQHVSSVCRASFFHLRALRPIRPVLTEDMATSIAVALIQSRLDYANSLLYHTSACNINKLQRVQNMAARLVLPNSQLPIADILSRLHWLPISKRIDFKIAAITYKVLHTGEPRYLRALIDYQVPARVTRSAVHSQYKLQESSVNLVFGERAFSSASPAVWNKLPLSVRSASSLPSFKRLLKTHYCSPTKPITT